MSDAPEVRRAARALNVKYGGLLAPQPSFRRPDVDRVLDQLDAARERLAGARPDPGQLALDLRR